MVAKITVSKHVRDIRKGGLCIEGVRRHILVGLLEKREQQSLCYVLCRKRYPASRASSLTRPYPQLQELP